MNKKSVTDVDVKGKRVLVRCDFNVPMKDGKITDENRIMGALPTIKYLMEHGAKVILCSHMGKPHNVFDAKVKLNKKEKKAVEALPADEQAKATEEYIEKAKKNDPVKLTLKPVADRLNELLGGKVAFAKDVTGPDAEAKVAACKEGECVLLENLRFYAGEEGRDLEFCKKLASYCDVYVNDAFGTAHRSHASTAAIVEYGLVKTAVCGFLIQKELEVMADSLEHPVRPFVAVLGGAKVADKLNVISNLLNKCDTLIIGGGMAYTFLKAEGYEIGKSLVDDDKLGYCKDMMQKAKDMGKKTAPADRHRDHQRVPQPDRRARRSQDGESQRDPCGYGRARHRRRNEETFRGRDQGRKDGHLERPHGCVRKPDPRKGHDRDRGSDGGGERRHDHHRRRRQRGRGAATRLCGQDDAYLHGRRRFP